MSNYTKFDSKKIIPENNSIFKQVNTNIIFDYQRNKYITDLIQNQDNYMINNTNINKNKNLQIYLNGTSDPDENPNFMKTQRTKFSNLSKNVNYNTNVTTTKNKPTLNRYNSYKRISTTNNNMNHLNNNKNKKISNKKNKIGINNNHSKDTINHFQKTPLTNKKKNVIPLGNNKFKTIGDNNYSNFGNKLYNDNNRTYFQKQEHSTIDLNNLYSNKNSNINKKYQMKKNNNNNNINNNNYNYNFNQHYNYNTTKPTRRLNNNNNNYLNNNNRNYNYNFHNVDLKRNGANIRPKTPDNNKRGKSSSRFKNINNNYTNNYNNQRAKTPDRQRNKMKLNLTKDYLNTIDNYQASNNKITNHTNIYNNYYIRDYHHTIDNSSNQGKYNNNKYSSKLNTNDYFKLNKKTINNYENKQNLTMTQYNTLTTNNSSRKNSFGKMFKNGNMTNTNSNINKNQRRLAKNSSQGNILGHNNYNINLNSNGNNRIYTNINDNYNKYKNYHSNCNTNLITPIKYVNQRSNFKDNNRNKDNIQMTQIRPPNNYNIYDETFQSFGRNIPNTINNNKNDKYDKKSNLYQNKIFQINTERYNNTNENNNYFEMKNKLDNIKEVCKNSDLELDNKLNYERNKILLDKNRNNETGKLVSKYKERNGKINNTYIPATINNTSNKTYSYFNDVQEKKKKENVNGINNDIDFNDLDQFSPPYSKAQVDLTKNNDINNNAMNLNINKYMNIGCIEERNLNYNTVNYDTDMINNNYNNNKFENKGGNNRKIIDDFIKQLKTNF